MWLGTADGIAVFYSPDEVFDNENFKAEQILIEQEGNVQILLESEVVTSIEIDGANRKWVGTQASGVYLLSSDGTKQIYHFTTENSPLLNNEISDIALNHGNGEVYFSTSDGIISFKGTATTGLLENSEPFVYPNPVPPGYEGVIAVKNLVANSYFKVIDIAGNMIYEGQTEGGQAIWNGKNYQGEKVETGVYLFLITNDTGKQTSTAKVLVTK
jgi:ligand-binding sensor domain-containing protein